MGKEVYMLSSDEDEERIRVAAERIAEEILARAPQPDLTKPYVSPDWDAAFEELSVETAIEDHLAELELTALIEGLRSGEPGSTQN